MKKKIICLIVVIISLLLSMNGCKENTNIPKGENDPRSPMPHLAYRGDSLRYDMENVTLTFYCGSENAGDGIGNYRDYPTVTYIYFANDETMTPQYVSNDPNKGYLMSGNDLNFNFVEEYNPKNLYNIIENNKNYSLCKKIMSTEADSFYKNNKVTLKYEDVQFVNNKFVEEDLWGQGNALYKINHSYKKGIYVPDISYTFTVPQAMFTKDSGYLSFNVASFFAEDFIFPSSDGNSEEGDLLEHRAITIYYTKVGKNVSLSSYYLGGK